MEDVWYRVLSFCKENLVIVIFLSVGLLFLSIGIFQLSLPEPHEVVFEAADASDTESQRAITVDVSGAVNSPGVYSLPISSRIQDALLKAGGVTAEADQTFVARDVNLAAKLTDGQKIYIPKVNETAQAVVGTSTHDKININSASATELDTLPGIGLVTAEKIIGGRPYSSLEELVEKKALGNSVFEKIKDKIQIY